MPENPPVRIHRTLATGLALAISTLIAVGASAPASAATDSYETLTVTADPSTVAVGDIVTVTVRATGLVDAYAYQLDLSYDAALLEFVADSGVLPAGGGGTVTAADQTVSAVATRLGTSPGLTGNQTLATFRFTALAAGTTGVALTSGSLVDTEGVTSAVDTNAPGLESGVTISAPTEPGEGADPEPGDADAGAGGTGTGSGSGSGPGAALAGTGSEAGPWLIAGSLAVAAAAAGAVMALRRRTR